MFLLPAFPFKDQNPFRSDLPPYAPDLGEIATLIHLHCMAMAVNQVFRHDVVWLIVSDGSAYEDIFRVPSGSAHQYLSALRDWRSRLNLTGSIHFIDLEDLVVRHDAALAITPGSTFSNVRREIAGILRSAVDNAEASESSIAVKINELARGMLWNRGWKEAEQRCGLDALWDIHCMSCDLERIAPEFHGVAQELWSESVETAIRYAAFNLASQRTRLLSRFMPSAIRATSHVKPGQVGIPRQLGVAPWNGLAIYDRSHTGTVSVHSVPVVRCPTVRMFVSSCIAARAGSDLQLVKP